MAAVPVTTIRGTQRLLGVSVRCCAAINKPLPPGPKPLPFIGNLLNYDKRMQVGDYRHVYDKYNSPIVMFNMVGMPLAFVSDVELAKQILRDRASDFTNGDPFRNVFGSLFPKSVIVVEGEQWQRIRRILIRAMQQTRIGNVMQPMCEIMDDFTKDLKEPVDMHRLAAEVTFDTFGRWGYDIDFGLRRGQNTDLLQACEEVAGCLASRTQSPPFLWKLPTPSKFRVDRAVETTRHYAEQLVQERESKLTASQDEYQSNILDAMIAASRAEEDARNRLTREELVDNICTIFFGAYDTTSATIAFTMEFLARCPAAQERLANELKDVDLTTLGADGLQELKYLDAVCREANRLRSTAPAFPRTAKKDVEVGGYKIPKGTCILVDHTSITARDPQHWGGQTDLDDFRPDRWYDVKPHRLASLPFGFGSRMCIGTQLATMEHKLTTAVFVQKYRWSCDPNRPMEITMKLGKCPANGCWLIPESRQ